MVLTKPNSLTTVTAVDTGNSTLKDCCDKADGIGLNFVGVGGNV
jgi:hypothetical protein